MIKCKACLAFYLFFRKKFIKFKNTGSQILDSVYHDIRITKDHIFGLKTSRFCHLLHNIIMDVITTKFKICIPLVVYCMAFLSVQEATSCDNSFYLQ